MKTNCASARQINTLLIKKSVMYIKFKNTTTIHRIFLSIYVRDFCFNLQVPNYLRQLSLTTMAIEEK